MLKDPAILEKRQNGPSIFFSWHHQEVKFYEFCGMMSKNKNKINRYYHIYDDKNIEYTDAPPAGEERETLCVLLSIIYIHLCNTCSVKSRQIFLNNFWTV